MVNLKVNSDMQVINMDSHTKRIIGQLEQSEGGITFKRAKLMLGKFGIPIRLSSEEEEALCWLMKEYY